MYATLTPLSQETLGSIHPQAARSIFWELDADAVARVEAKGDPAFEKEAWLATVLMDYGCCGFSIGRSTSDRAVATTLFCPRTEAPGVVAFPTAPVSEDAEVLSSLFIDPGFAGVGLEAVLIDAVIMELVARDARAIEAFGWRSDFFARPDVDTLLDGSVGDILGRGTEIGLMSVEVLESAGFQVIADHPVLPRLRLDLPPQQNLLSAADVELLLARADAC